MTSPSPLQCSQYYHIFNRGNNGDNAFFSRENYRYFLSLYAKYIMPVADTFAYCLMPNHFHLLVRIKNEEEIAKTFRVSETLKVCHRASQQFSNLFNAYAKAINKTYHRTGSVFENPFGRVLVTSDTYYARLVVYIHRNPQKHGLIDDFRAWPYSSYQTLFSTKSTNLLCDDVLVWFGGAAGLAEAHQQDITEQDIAPLAPEDLR